MLDFFTEIFTGRAGYPADSEVKKNPVNKHRTYSSTMKDPLPNNSILGDIWSKDPVYSIALQNPTAQPGFGKAPMAAHRNDLAELFGIQSREPFLQPVQLAHNPPQSFGQYGSARVTVDDIHKAYYGFGTRIDGAGLAVHNCPQDIDHLFINLPADRNKLKRVHDWKNHTKNFVDNTVVFTGTTFNKNAVPVNFANIKRTSTNTFVDPSPPPKMVYSASDYKSFQSY